MHVSAIGAPHLVDPSRLEQQRAPALRRHVRLALGRARPGAGGERARRRRSRARARLLPDAGPRVAPRLLPRPRRHALRRRRVRRTHPAAAASSCRRHRRPRSTSRPGRTRSTRSSAALPSGSRSSTSASPRTSERHLAELRLELLRLGRVGRGRRERGGVRRVRARRARATRREDAPTYGLRDAALAVVPRPRSAGPRSGSRACRPSPSATHPVVDGPLRLRDFRLLFAARAISYIGTYLAPIAVAFAVLDNGGGATAVGLSFAAWTLAQVAMLAFGGVVGDRVPRRLVMIGSDCRAASSSGRRWALLLVSGHAEVWQLIALQACGGAAVAFYSPASFGLTREVVPTDDAPAGERAPRDRPLRSVPARRGDRRLDRRRSSAPGRRCSSTRARTPRALCSSRGSTSSRSPAPGRASCASSARAGARSSSRRGCGCSSLWISLYFLFTYAPFFVLGPYVAKHSMNGARSWSVRRRRRGSRCAARRHGGTALAAATRPWSTGRLPPDGHGGAEPHPRVPPRERSC